MQRAFLISVLVVFCSLISYSAEEKLRESSKQLETVDGKTSFYAKPLPVQAGHTPIFVGEVFQPRIKKYPGFLDLHDSKSIQIAKDLVNIDGVNRSLGSFLPASWKDIRGVPLAFVENDLIAAGYSGTSSDANIGLLDIFRIELAVPEYETEFPADLVLHIEFKKNLQERILPVDIYSEHRDGVYKLLNPKITLLDFGEIYEFFGPRRGFDDVPTTMALTKVSGFNPQKAISELPPIEGAMLIHHIYIGSFRVVSGWQWAGRPTGLFESQQLGFVQ